MDDAMFWQLVDLIDREALTDGDEDAALAALKQRLEGLPAGEIEAFEETLARKLRALDGPAVAAAAGKSGGSDDGFLYARCYVVASGRARYEQVLADPTVMSNSVDDWCEGLLEVAADAYEASTGQLWRYVASVSYESGSNRELWKRG